MDAREKMARQLEQSICKQVRAELKRFDAFLEEFPDAEQYHGDAARYWFQHLRESINALLFVAER